MMTVVIFIRTDMYKRKRKKTWEVKRDSCKIRCRWIDASPKTPNAGCQLDDCDSEIHNRLETVIISSRQ